MMGERRVPHRLRDVSKCRVARSIARRPVGSLLWASARHVEELSTGGCLVDLVEQIDEGAR